MALGGRTVAEWRMWMSQAEFERWGEFYRLYPFDDRHRYHRPAALVATSFMGGGQERFEEMMEVLQPRRDRPSREDLTQSDMDLYKALGLKV